MVGDLVNAEIRYVGNPDTGSCGGFHIDHVVANPSPDQQTGFLQFGDLRRKKVHAPDNDHRYLRCPGCGLGGCDTRIKYMDGKL